MSKFVTYFSPTQFINFVDFINHFFSFFNLVKDITLDIFMTIGPSTNYVFQAIKFYNTKSSIGFSNFVCLVTIMAHTTKVYFWFGERYAYTLLIQSLLVIIIQLYIIYLCVKYREKSEKLFSYSLLSKKEISLKEKTKKCLTKIFLCSETLNPKLIWRWDNAFDYYKFYFLVVAILTALLFLFGIENKIFANIIGYINLVLELLSSCPQIIELYRTKNQRNISKLMVFLWFTGNVIKIYYNYLKNSPLQLILGAYVQVFFNIILIGQLIYYYRKNKKELNKENNKENIDNNILSDENNRYQNLSLTKKSQTKETKENEEIENNEDDKHISKDKTEEEFDIYIIDKKYREDNNQNEDDIINKINTL